ncbi:DUF4145 domain-containing protein [Variovorax boronicumulans]
MNWFEVLKVALDFIEKIVASLAWPVVVVLVAVMFRDKLTKLFDDVTELKGLGVEAKFARGVEKALVQAEEIEVSQPQGAEPSLPDESQGIPVDGELPPIHPVNFLLAETNPRAAILVGRANIEAAAKRLAQSKGVQGSPHLFGTLRALRDAGVISLQEFDTANDLRLLANDAAHDESFQPRKTSAINFARAVNKVTAAFVNKARGK